jgi:hypothetical protein
MRPPVFMLCAQSVWVADMNRDGALRALCVCVRACAPVGAGASSLWLHWLIVGALRWAAPPYPACVVSHETPGPVSRSPPRALPAVRPCSLLPLPTNTASVPGALDVLSASSSDDRIAWHRSEGVGAARNFALANIDTTADSGTCVVAADVNDDGYLDVLATSQLDHTVAMYRNNGVQQWAPSVVSVTSRSPQFLTAADMDGDGGACAQLSTLLNTALHCFALLCTLTIPHCSSLLCIVVRFSAL